MMKTSCLRLTLGGLLIGTGLIGMGDVIGQDAPERGRSARADLPQDPFANSSTFSVSNDPFAGSVSSGQSSIDSERANDRIRAALQRTASHSFDEMPLAEVARVISDTHKIPLVLDKQALEEIGLSTEEPIRIALKDVSLNSFLELMLGPLDLVSMVDNEVLIITTPEKAESNLHVRVYSLAAPLFGQGNEVITAMQKTVSPESWDKMGGRASAVAVLDKLIVVSGTDALHDEVQDLLDRMKRALESE
jgi:hypothetical protein